MILIIQVTLLNWKTEIILLSISFQDDFEKSLSNVFRILVLTVPSMYAVAYFTLWQNIVTRLDMILGGIMLIIQVRMFI